MDCRSVVVRRGLPLLMFLVTFVETDSFSAAVAPSSSSPFASLVSATTTTTRSTLTLIPTAATTDAKFCNHGLTRSRFSSSFLSGRTSTFRLAASTQAKEAVTSKSDSVPQQPYSFIQTELRGAAMKLHTKSQAPREGQAKEPERTPHVTTHTDYLAYLVDNLHVYQAFEEIVRQNIDELGVFSDTGLERCEALEQDIDYMMQTYNLPRPAVSAPGRDYAQLLRNSIAPLLPDRVPEFTCHYYNFYFAHTAGGRMIGKQLSAQLLDRKTLQFYVWNKGDLNDLKDVVKANIEDLAATWNAEQKQQCVDATAAAFSYGGAINGHLSGRVSS